MSTPGRPPALDPAKRQRVIALLTIGCSRPVAARHVGCAPSTITRTAARDPAFADQLAQAETNLEVELLDSIRAIREGGGFGSIIGRNSFQRSKNDGLKLLRQIMEIYADQKK